MMLVALWLVAFYVATRKRYTIWRSDAKKYLTRLYIVGQWFRDLFHCRPYIHVFHSSDDAEFHNHRWKWSYGLILWRGYSEQRVENNCGYAVRTGLPCEDHLCKANRKIIERRFRMFSINKLDSNCFHRVDLYDEKPCVTLFLAGPFASEDWGFLKDDGTIEYARDRFAGRRDDLSDD